MGKAWEPEPRLREDLFAAIPPILSSQREDGRFGTEPWICQDQNVLLSLAAAWSLEGSPFFHSQEVLEAIARGGEALVGAQDEEGMWTFRKKDDSTWGQIHMPWTYSRWVRAYRLVREAMPESPRRRWEEGLLKGYEGIARTALERIHNIPTHHAMGLYCAGQVFGRREWEQQAREFLGRVVAAQSEHGWWSEHYGPVVGYNFVYSDALGIYYAMSGDEKVLEALERAARFHARYVYPDGSLVETVDERNPYHRGVQLGNVGFTHTAAGRGFLRQQHDLHLEAGGRFDADYAAHLLLYGGEGPSEETAAGRQLYQYTMGDQALIARQRPWFISLSAYACPPLPDRWRQDRQNFVSVFHDGTGLIVGGGNTKLQPLWSTFTVGDIGALRHVPGDEDPDFQPKGLLFHLPERAILKTEGNSLGLELRYGEEDCRISVIPENDTELRLEYAATARSGLPVEAHVPLIPRLDQPLCLASGEQVRLGEEPREWSGTGLAHAGWRLQLPDGARLVWPVLPHNPYRKGGEATVEEALLVVVLPFCGQVSQCAVQVSIDGKK